MGGLIVISASYDANTSLWTARSSELGGIFLQATSWKVLVESVPGAVGKLVPRRLFRPSYDIAIEVVSHASARDGVQAIASIHSPV